MGSMVARAVTRYKSLINEDKMLTFLEANELSHNFFIPKEKLHQWSLSKKLGFWKKAAFIAFCSIDFLHNFISLQVQGCTLVIGHSKIKISPICSKFGTFHLKKISQPYNKFKVFQSCKLQFENWNFQCKIFVSTYFCTAL